jgi:hypothetical protein
MRCYFMRGGRIEAVEELIGLSDEQAIAKAHALFSERKHKFEGFELWNRTRVIVRHPEPAASNNVARRRSRHKAAILRGWVDDPQGIFGPQGLYALGHTELSFTRNLSASFCASRFVAKE